MVWEFTADPNLIYRSKYILKHVCIQKVMWMNMILTEQIIVKSYFFSEHCNCIYSDQGLLYIQYKYK